MRLNYKILSLYLYTNVCILIWIAFYILSAKKAIFERYINEAGVAQPG